MLHVLFLFILQIVMFCPSLMADLQAVVVKAQCFYKLGVHRISIIITLHSVFVTVQFKHRNLMLEILYSLCFYNNKTPRHFRQVY